MKQRGGMRLTSLMCGLWLGVLSCAVHAQVIYGSRGVVNQRPEYRPRLLVDESPRAEHYVGIVGAVHRPAVYLGDSRFIAIDRIVSAAGGLTSEASGVLRIVRDGRPGLQIRYSPGCRDFVAAGDVVIADRVRTLVASPTDGAALVDVAFVGLLERPVVFSLRLEDAAIPTLLGLLGQPLDLPLQIVRSGPGSRDASRLSSGIVLTFLPTDGQQIDRQGLARAVASSRPLPAALPLSTESAAPAAPEEAALPAEDIAPTGRVNVDPPAASLPPTTLPADLASVVPATPRLALSPHAPALIDMSLPSVAGSPIAESPIVESLPAELSSPAMSADAVRPSGATFVPAEPLVVSALKRMGSDPVGSAPLAPPPPPEQARPEQAQTEPAQPESAPLALRPSELTPAPANLVQDRGPGNASADLAADRSPIADATPLDSLIESAPSPPASGAPIGLFALLTAAIALVCLAGSLAWARNESGKQPHSPPAPADVESDRAARSHRADDPLNELIDDHLPIVEVPVVLRFVPTLHGRAIGRQRLMIHGRHEMEGPHFPVGAPSERETRHAGALVGESAAAGHTRKGDTLEPPGNHGPRDEVVLPEPAPARMTALERALTSMHREKRP